MIQVRERYDLKVAWCKLCDQGWVTIRKVPAIGRYCVICEECEAEWDHPLHAQYNILSKEWNDNSVEDPSFEEISELGWDEYIIRK